MKTLTIAVIAGDGVGQEVVPEARRVLERAAQKHNVTFAFQDFDWGAAHFFRWGKMMPSGALDLLQPCDAILLGAWVTLSITWAEVPDEAWNKWDWAFKTILFCVFLTLVLRSRVQLEAFVQVHPLLLSKCFQRGESPPQSVN